MTQTPDYILPSSACLLQDRLRLPRNTAAFGLDLGCSGYIYGMAVADAWLAAGHGSKALVVTGDTLTPYLRPGDASTRLLFGDCVTVSLLEACPAEEAALGSLVFGTDGAGAEHLIIRTGGAREPCGPQGPLLEMDGAKVFEFALDVVPPSSRNAFASPE